jgi:hypothetical protein
MKVYVTFEKDGHNGEQIEKVFADEAKAQDHVIETRLSLNMAYVNYDSHQLEEEALEYIEECEVIK